MSDIYRIVLTGGPGGGKSTSLEVLTQRLTTHGFKVFCVPEVATMIFKSGMEIHGLHTEQLLVLQENMIKCQIAMEDSFYDIAKSYDADSVIFFDRGTMDPRAFMSPEIWDEALERNNWTESELRDPRYDGIIHMSTAADGAEEFYTTENNDARAESAEEACQVDNKIKSVWVGHPHLRVIESCEDFSTKLNKVFKAVSRIVGIPEKVEIERKYLLDGSFMFPLAVKKVDSLIYQTYLKDTSRIRCRVYGDLSMYTHTFKEETDIPGKRTEVENRITVKEYNVLMNDQDPERVTIMKVRTCFLWDGQYFELDRYHSPESGMCVLEIELDDIDQEIRLPPYLSIVSDVTNDKRYSNYNIAKNTEGLDKVMYGS